MIWPLLFLLLASFLGSTNPVFLKFGLDAIPPITFTSLRFLFAALALLPFWLRKPEFISPKDIYKALPFSANIVFFSLGAQYTSVIMSNLLYTVVPITVAVLAYIFLKEKLTRAQLFGLIAAVFGIGLLLQGSFETNDILSFGLPMGNILVAIAVACWSFYPIGARSLSKKYSTTTIVFTNFVLTALIAIILIPVEWNIRPVTLDNVTPKVVIGVLGGAFLGTLLYYYCYQWLIKNTSAFLSSLILYGTFVTSILYGAVFFGEYVTSQLLIGAALIMTGVFLATTYTQLKKRR